MSAALPKIETVPSSSVKEILQDKKRRIRLFLLLGGILLIGLGLSQEKFQLTGSNIETQEKQEVVSFSQEPVVVDKNLLNVSKQKEKTKFPPLRILIPELEIDLAVKEAKVVKGYWEVFPDVAGFGLGSSYPVEVGNQVIFAHARKGLFLPLKNAKLGQMIYVLTKDEWYSYKIEEIKEVLPNQTEVIAPTVKPILTLYTCSGYSDSKRLIVQAVRLD